MTNVILIVLNKKNPKSLFLGVKGIVRNEIIDETFQVDSTIAKYLILNNMVNHKNDKPDLDGAKAYNDNADEQQWRIK